MGEVEGIEVFGGAIAFVLKQAADGTAIGEVCRNAGRLSEATFYNWRKYYAGLMPPEVKRISDIARFGQVVERSMKSLSRMKIVLNGYLVRVGLINRSTLDE